MTRIEGGAVEREGEWTRLLAELHEVVESHFVSVLVGELKVE